jgi:ferredoxin-NADP reductase
MVDGKAADARLFDRQRPLGRAPRVLQHQGPERPLTSRLQHLKVGDDVLVGRKPTGTLVLTDLLPGRNLYLFATGTGLAPFMSIIRDPDTYERFAKIVLVHGVRKVDELAYADLIATTCRVTTTSASRCATSSSTTRR